MVIVRCCGPSQFFLERVVFPFELLSFACPPESEVEIWTHSLGGPELLESLPAENLLISPGSRAVNPVETFLDSPWLAPPTGGPAFHGFAFTRSLDPSLAPAGLTLQTQAG